MSQRSLISGYEGFITYSIWSKEAFYRPNYIITFLKANFEESVVRTVKWIKLCRDDHMAVFDVPQKNAFIFNKYIELDKEEKSDSFELAILEKLPELKTR